MKPIHKIKPERSANGRNLEYGNPNTKKQLARDFHCCCGYCGDAHHYTGGIKSFHVDHFAPKSKFPDNCNQYGNLVYSCPYCNNAKSNKWVGKTMEQSVVNDVGIVDPCSMEYSKHLERNNDGSITYKTSVGKYMYIELKLYLERHKLLHQLQELKDKINLIKQKIEDNIEKNKSVKRLQEMNAILCEAYFYYFNEYCKDLDSVLW